MGFNSVSTLYDVRCRMGVMHELDVNETLYINWTNTGMKIKVVAKDAKYNFRTPAMIVNMVYNIFTLYKIEQNH